MANSWASSSLRQPWSPPKRRSEIEEVAPASSVVDEEEETKVYVAVPKDLKEGIEMVLWVLQNTSMDNKIVLLHVHRPPKLFPMMGAMVPASKLGEEHVRKYRQQERMMVEKSLDSYLIMCSKTKFRAEKLVIENDDIGSGIIELVASHRITKLVMGAAADRHYSRNMTSPKSKISITVQQKAHLSCKIWFVCKGKLICTRDAAINESSSSSCSDQLRSKSLPLRQPEHLNWVISLMQRLPTAPSRTSANGSVTYPWESSSRSSQSSSDSNWLWSSTDEFNNTNGIVTRLKDDDGDSFSVMEGGDFDRDVCDRLEQVQAEAENTKHEVYTETFRNQIAEINAIEAPWKGKASESQHDKKLKQRTELQKMLANEIKENERLENDRDEMLQGLQEARAREAETESRVAGSMELLKEFEDKLSKAQQNLEKLRAECEELKQARDNAAREAQNLCRRNGETSGGEHEQLKFSVFSYSELQGATKNFDDSLKIGEGRYGSVFKGILRCATVAIKLLNLRGLPLAEFLHEVEVLSSVRHPHLVTLIGTCPEASALIYEYLPRGSLDDRLACKDNTDPLPCDVRIRISAEICSALIFLRSNKPHGVIHGDLKPSNILLDANFHSKLSGFGVNRLLSQFNTTHTPCCHSNPEGTLVSMDPDYISSGDITLAGVAADVYCFGIILMRLLTGKPALGIINQVQEAVNKEKLHSMLDCSAGKWPYIQAKQLAQLALKCCDARRKKRPSLEGEAWNVLEPMLKVNECGKLHSLSCSSVSKNNISIPSYFICPISKELMKDPHIAEDGFTYEAEVIKDWFESGHNTSPVTSRQFQHHYLIPNRLIRSSIQEWLQMNG